MQVTTGVVQAVLNKKLIEIYPEDIKEFLAYKGIECPDNAEIFVKVPGIANLTIDKDYPLRVMFNI